MDLIDILMSQKAVARQIGDSASPISAALNAAYTRKDRVHVTDYLTSPRIPGTTDDTAAFLAARDALTTGDTLVIAPGQYKVGQVVQFTLDDLTIDARGAVIELVDDGTAEGVNFRAKDCQHFVWLGGRITQTAAARTGVYGLLSLFNVTGALVDAVTTIGGSSAGIFTSGGGGHVYNAPTVRDTKADGIHISRGTSDVVIESATVSNVGDDAIAIVAILTNGGATYPQIKNVTVSNPKVNGASTNLGSGVVFIGCADCILTGGVIRGMPAAGVKFSADSVAGATMNASNIAVTGTLARECNVGFSAGQSDDCTITGVQSINNSDSGLSIVSATRLHVVGGKYRGNAGFGVYEASGTGNTIIGADLRGNTLNASQVASAVLTSCVTA